MKEKTKDWLKITISILVFNSVIIVMIFLNKLINLSTVTLKIILDIAIGFISDKTIKKLKINWKDGLTVER